MFDNDCCQYYILSKCSSKIQLKMLSGNYAPTLQGGGEGTQKVSCVGSLLGTGSLTVGVFARGEREPWRAIFPAVSSSSFMSA